MNTERRVLWWAAAIFLVVAALYAVSAVLLPFVVGIALAYLLDPLADWLERKGSPRWLAATVITLVAVFVLALAIVLLVPMLLGQIEDLARKVPGYLEQARDGITRLLGLLQEWLSDEEMKTLREKIGGIANPESLGWIGTALGKLWGGGVALFNLLSLLFVTPIVAWYLLRDWDRMVAVVDGWLPRDRAATVRAVMRDIDRVLSGFVRGQFIVCTMLAAFYAVGLTLVGLEFGLVIGLLTGLLSFIPYFGMLIGFALGLGVAFAQFGLSLPVLLVAGVFILGQVIEGNFVTPKLVGDRVGLHPVWTIFALLAGGAVAGFLGLLLAVPVAAVIGVLVRFALDRYRESDAYRGDDVGGERGGGLGGI